MKLKFERRVMELDLYGDIYLLKFPTQSQIDSHGKLAHACIIGESDKTENELVRGFLIECGLAEEIVKKTEQDHVMEIFKKLTDGKKS